MMKRMLAIFGALTLVLCLTVFFCTRSYYAARLAEAEEEPQKAEHPPVTVKNDEGKWLQKEIVLSGETIASGLKEIGKLCTAEYYFTHVETFESAVDLWGFTIPGTKASYVYSYDGRILAGVDFTKVTVEVEGDVKRIIVTLPSVELITSEIDEDSFTLYGEKKSLFNPFEVQDFALSLQDMIRAEERKAKDDGLMERAAENAETILRNFLAGSLGVEGYSVDVRVGKSV